ncbi:MAG: Ham1 family protein [Candidatus Giovannonibacteria bacterium GW2011_GWA2_53_7]|uniref:Ham1 family protein n=1 Tax=Candidatus Giovannonibacteria bacterium GW2011_GWA2_53_7 TaxID=1618650 RepID=A0A0G1XUB0_9BACT|nr:MAG: Ham1 family protein [Candidatus Giovannonibacteria bacterium GW2011_GWA2_53_7]
MIYFITGNKLKFAEGKSILPELEQLEIDLPEIQEIDARQIIEAKLSEAFKHHKGEFIVEDTSLYLDCMKGLPGPLIKWFLQTIGNIGLVNIAERFGDPKSTARTLIGYARSPEDIHFFEGSVEGHIVQPQGEAGFGWDSIFQPVGYEKTFKEMGVEEKNKISMRRVAFDQLKNFLLTETQ